MIHSQAKHACWSRAWARAWLRLAELAPLLTHGDLRCALALLAEKARQGEAAPHELRSLSEIHLQICFRHEQLMIAGGVATRSAARGVPDDKATKRGTSDDH